MPDPRQNPAVRVATRKVRVEVTQQDIDRGRPRDSGRCVVATALARSLPEAHHFLVDVAAIRFTLNEERWHYIPPTVVAAYVVAFDAGDVLEPMTFELRDALVRPIVRRPGVGGRPPGSNVASKERTPPLFGGGRKRDYGSRSLRINQDRFVLATRTIPAPETAP
jgi:hypothetical protein